MSSGSDSEVSEAEEEEENRPEDRVGLSSLSAIKNQDGGLGENGQRFRIHNTRVLLTYSSLYLNELTKEGVRVALEAKCRGGCLEFMICIEPHTDPADPLRPWHVHAYICSNVKWDTRNPKFFDLRGKDDRSLHPYMQSMGTEVADRTDTLSYLIKVGNVNMRLASLWDMSGRVHAPGDWGHRVRDAPDVASAEQQLRVHSPEVLYKFGTTILARKAEEDSARRQVGRGYGLEDFNHAPLNVKDKAVVLHGKAGTGKTAFAVAHFAHPLLVSELDGLKKFKAGTHDGIIFDDVDCSNMTPEAVIHLLDMDYDREIPLRYAPATIPAHTPRVFTTNLKRKKMFPKGKSSAQNKGIKRRFTAVEVTHKMFG